MSTPTPTSMLALITQARTRTLRTTEACTLREGIRDLATAKAATDGLRLRLHHADHDAVTLAAALHRIQAILNDPSQRPPSARLDAIHGILRGAHSPEVTP